jgi:hypothetical protein
MDIDRAFRGDVTLDHEITCKGATSGAGLGGVGPNLDLFCRGHGRAFCLSSNSKERSRRKTLGQPPHWLIGEEARLEGRVWTPAGE